MAKLQRPGERDLARHLTEGWTVIAFSQEKYETDGFLTAMVEWVCGDDVPGFWYPVKGEGRRATRIALSSPIAAMAFKVQWC